MINIQEFLQSSRFAESIFSSFLFFLFEIVIIYIVIQGISRRNINIINRPVTINFINRLSTLHRIIFDALYSIPQHYPGITGNREFDIKNHLVSPIPHHIGEATLILNTSAASLGNILPLGSEYIECAKRTYLSLNHAMNAFKNGSEAVYVEPPIKDILRMHEIFSYLIKQYPIDQSKAKIHHGMDIYIVWEKYSNNNTRLFTSIDDPNLLRYNILFVIDRQCVEKLHIPSNIQAIQTSHMAI